MQLNATVKQTKKEDILNPFVIKRWDFFSFLFFFFYLTGNKETQPSQNLLYLFPNIISDVGEIPLRIKLISWHVDESC